jgi:5-methylcytosine-specific restriction enzyme A
LPEYKTKEQKSKFYNSKPWKQLREDIKKRDNYECQWCKEEGGVNTSSHTVLEVDHIKELEHHPELALEEDNLRTLCRDCHNKRHKRFNYKVRQKEKKWPDEWW